MVCGLCRLGGGTGARGRWGGGGAVGGDLVQAARVRSGLARHVPHDRLSARTMQRRRVAGGGLNTLGTNLRDVAPINFFIRYAALAPRVKVGHTKGRDDNTDV